jgi:hypothetical protein
LGWQISAPPIDFNFGPASGLDGELARADSVMRRRIVGIRIGPLLNLFAITGRHTRASRFCLLFAGMVAEAVQP